MGNLKNKIITAIFTVFVFLFIISFSIGLPIYFRPFYYAHINALNLPNESGHTYEEIKDAYDSVLDYLTMPGGEFDAGVMRYSEDGEAHFADCKTLFLFCGTVILVSAVVILLTVVFTKLGKIERPKIGKRCAEFYSALIDAFLPIILGGLAALDFNKAFRIFHSIFFSGKSNWIFDPYDDEIINVLPIEFFMNCGILIAVSVLVISLTIIVKEIISVKKDT